MRNESKNDYQNQLESKSEFCENGKIDKRNSNLKFAYCEVVDRTSSCDLSDLSMAENQLNELIKNAVLINEGED